MSCPLQSDQQEFDFVEGNFIVCESRDVLGQVSVAVGLYVTSCCSARLRIALAANRRTSDFPLINAALKCGRHFAFHEARPNLEGLASGLVNDEIGKNSVEQNVLARQVGAPMTGVGNVGEGVKAFEQLGYDSVRRLDSLSLVEVKPDGVDIEDGGSRD